MNNSYKIQDEEILLIIEENAEAMRLFYEMYEKIMNGDR